MTPPAEAGAARPISILYVEDNEYLREAIGALFDGEGREVVLAANGEEASKRCTERRFDLVVTDVSLPGMSGIDLARRLLAAEPARWIVICSGYDFAANVAQLGPNVRVLRKPFEIEALDALLAEAMASRAAAGG